MLKVVSRLCSLLVLFSLIGNELLAQRNQPFPLEPDKFILDFSDRMVKSRIPLARELMPELLEGWNMGQFSAEEQEQFIKHTNLMLKKRYAIGPEIGHYTKAFMRIKQAGAYVKIPLSDFWSVTESCISLGPDRVNAYLKNLIAYLPEGNPATRKRFYWHASQTDPKLVFLEKKYRGQTYKAPIIQYSETDLIYASARDSAIIHRTSGNFNLISQSFSGNGGKIDWSKVGLNPDEVYCNFNNYKLDFNYGTIEADSVDFYYLSLFSNSLLGSFEDRNIGHKDPNKANYPHFRSYSGGIVIEDLIPNIRYEGGFSLRGTRKVGTSYDIVDPSAPIPEDPEMDGFFTEDKEISEMNEDEAWSEESGYESDFEDLGDGSWDPHDEEDYMGASKHVKAKLLIQRGDEAAMKLQGEAFVFDQDYLYGNHLEATIYADDDSLYHPGMDLIYTGETQTVTLKKPKKGTYASIPFASSFHEYYFYFEAIKWDLTTDELHFTAFIDREHKTSAIESFDYFTKSRFSQFKNVMKINPIGAIYRYAVRQGYDAQSGQLKEEVETPPSIFVSSILRDYEKSNFRVADQRVAFDRSLPALEGSGFIRYDKRTKEISPLPKLFIWGMAARGKKDFDAIQVISKVDSGSHAIMDMQSKTIKMRGVPYFSLSDSQYVKVTPYKREVTIKKNRNLLFAGKVEAGKIDLYAAGEDSYKFVFNYENFSIQCDSIDSVRFVLVRNPDSGYKPSPLEIALSNTVFEGITGAIHIDDPNNKSGQKDYDHYPVFDSYSSSYLYWSHPEIQGGVYSKDKMYFSVDPFVLDSLSYFDNSGLRFDGEFFSSEIFPKFKQTLAVMDDGTLGFDQKTPEEGYYVYDRKGRFFNDIILDGSGLHGNGKLEHMGTVIESDSFTFHFDSVMAVVHNFSMERGYRKGARFPAVSAESGIYKWYTKEDKLSITSKDQPIVMFEGVGEFTGTLSMTEKGMVGNGSILIDQIEITGDSLVFDDRELDVENARFAIVDKDDPELLHFVAEGVRVNYDTYRMESTFESKATLPTLAIFPIHQYRTSLTSGVYSKETNELELKGVSTYEKDNYFQAIGPAADSLTFAANASHYDVDSRSIEVKGVPYIYVADALITPEKMEVTITDDGIIKKLDNAVIVIDKPVRGSRANTDSIYHKIYDAMVDIYSAHEYEGSGKYDYIKVGGKAQHIIFDNIKVSSDTITLATGEIEEDKGFYLTDRIFFKGIAELDASEKYLKFDGEVKIESENPVFKGAWFTFEKTVVNPDSVYIPIPRTIKNDDGELLTVGLNFVPDMRFFYSNFLQAKTDDDDFEIISASGGLTLDRRTQEFKIGSEAKIMGRTLKGSTVSFDDKKNTITSKGYLDFPYDFLAKTVSMDMSGSWKESINNGEVSTDLLIGINIGEVIPSDQLDKIAENFLFLTTSNKDIDFNQISFLSDISELLDKGGSTNDRETRKFLKSVNNAMVYTDIKLASLLPYTFLLSNVNFHYNEDERALFSDSELGLIGINGKPINKMIDAKIVYQFGDISPSGEKTPDEITLYMEIDDVNWTYFHISGEEVRTFSGYYDDYNYRLQDVLDKQKGEQSGFHFNLASEDEVNEFLQSFIMRFMSK